MFRTLPAMEVEFGLKKKKIEDWMSLVTNKQFSSVIAKSWSFFFLDRYKNTDYASVCVCVCDCIYRVAGKKTWSMQSFNIGVKLIYQSLVPRTKAGSGNPCHSSGTLRRVNPAGSNILFKVFYRAVYKLWMNMFYLGKHCIDSYLSIVMWLLSRICQY